jgi:hypothetical protein
LLILIVAITIVTVVLVKDTIRCYHRALVDMKLELLRSWAMANQLRKLAHKGLLSSYCNCFQLIVVCQYDDSQYRKLVRLCMRGLLMTYVVVSAMLMLLSPLCDTICTISPS